MVQPTQMFGAPTGPKVDIGLIGCGGRGQWIAELFRKHGGYNVVAVADYFPDKADAAGDKFGSSGPTTFQRTFRLPAAAGTEAGCGGH